VACRTISEGTGHADADVQTIYIYTIAGLSSDQHPYFAGIADPWCEFNKTKMQDPCTPGEVQHHILLQVPHSLS